MFVLKEKVLEDFLLGGQFKLVLYLQIKLRIIVILMEQALQFIINEQNYHYLLSVREMNICLSILPIM